MASRLNFICVDNSPFSENGFDWYLNNCHRKEDLIGIVHVQQVPALPYMMGVVYRGGIPLMDEYEKNIQDSITEAQECRKKFQKICKEKELKCQFFTEQPDHSPGHTICELAKREKANAIVMGQRGLGTVSRALLGSTSDYVLHHSTIPIVVVPPPPENK